MASRIIEEISKLSVLEIAALIKEFEVTFGVSAAAPVAAAAVAAAPAAAQEEKTAFKVTLKTAGDDKIKTIKALREVSPTLSLKDAKDKVEGVPCVIAESASKDDAKKMKEKLEAAGASVELS